MSVKYNICRFEPRCLNEENNPGCVCEIVVGLVAETIPEAEGDKTYSAYIDGIWNPPEGEMLMVGDLTAEKCSQIASQFAADNNWVESLNGQIEANKQQPINAENFEVPELTLDTTVEAAVVENPDLPEPEPTPEPVVDNDEEEEDTSEE